MPEDIRSRAEELRLEGNALYTSGDFPKALEKYSEAHGLAPKSYLPLANLAAVCFEMGDYAQSNRFADEALSLLDQGPESQSRRARLILRKVRSCVYAGDHEGARTIYEHDHTEELLRDPEWLDLSRAITNGNAVQYAASSISPFKPVLGLEAHSEVIGDDKPTSLFDVSLLGSDSKSLDFLFANAGDARHVFASVKHIAQPAIKRPDDLQLRFVIADDNALVLARQLVILSLLDAVATSAATPRDSQELAALFYTYMAPIMPLTSSTILQQHIERTIAALGKNALPAHISVLPNLAVLEVLRFWSQKAQETFPVTQVWNVLDEELHNSLGMDTDLFPSGLRKEAKSFRKTCMLQSCLNDGTTSSISRAVQLKSSDDAVGLQDLSNNWKTNVTLLSTSKSRFQSLAFDPFDFGSKISTQEISGDVKLADLICEWLISTATALQTLKGNVSITFRMLSDILPRPNEPLEQQSDTFDRVHLSAVPDLGGSLFVYLYGIPLLKDEATSYLTWKCSQLCSSFSSWIQYDQEFLAMATGKKAASYHQQIFGVKVDDEVYAGEAESHLFDSTSISGYRKARHLRPSRLQFPDLVPRDVLKKWLDRMLLKTILPHIDETVPSSAILSPFSLRMYIDLLQRLSSRGFPAHWYGLNDITVGKLRTSARPPASSPLKTKEINATLAERLQKVGFSSVELSGLLAQFAGELSFGAFNYCSIPTDDIVKFQVKLKVVAETNTELATFVLLIEGLSSTEVGVEKLSLNKTRLAQLDQTNMITCFQWHAASSTATFRWSRSSMQVLSQSHKIQMWHVESWTPYTNAVPLKEAGKQE